MNTTALSIDIYTEMTPNPATMKFVLNKMLLSNRIAEFGDIASATKSPLATELFGFPYVKSVFIMNNFVKNAEIRMSKGSHSFIVRPLKTVIAAPSTNKFHRALKSLE